MDEEHTSSPSHGLVSSPTRGLVSSPSHGLVSSPSQGLANSPTRAMATGSPSKLDTSSPTLTPSKRPNSAPTDTPTKTPTRTPSRPPAGAAGSSRTPQKTPTRGQVAAFEMENWRSPKQLKMSKPPQPQDSPFTSFARTLSPITPAKTVHVQTYNELCPRLSPLPPNFNTPKHMEVARPRPSRMHPPPPMPSGHPGITMPILDSLPDGIDALSRVPETREPDSTVPASHSGPESHSQRSTHANAQSDGAPDEGDGVPGGLVAMGGEAAAEEEEAQRGADDAALDAEDDDDDEDFSLPPAPPPSSAPPPAPSSGNSKQRTAASSGRANASKACPTPRAVPSSTRSSGSPRSSGHLTRSSSGAKKAESKKAAEKKQEQALVSDDEEKEEKPYAIRRRCLNFTGSSRRSGPRRAPGSEEEEEEEDDEEDKDDHDADYNARDDELYSSTPRAASKRHKASSSTPAPSTADVAARTPAGESPFVDSEDPSSSKSQQPSTPCRRCNCKKSKCLKLYCECFAAGVYCTDCQCQNCLNRPAHKKLVKHTRQQIEMRNPLAFTPKIVSAEAASKASRGVHKKGCNCKRSFCLKKYCECFQAGVQCTDACKCENCKNCGPGGPTPRDPAPEKPGSASESGGQSGAVSPRGERKAAGSSEVAGLFSPAEAAGAGTLEDKEEAALEDKDKALLKLRIKQDNRTVRISPNTPSISFFATGWEKHIK